MEWLSRTKQYAGKTDCSQQISETNAVHDGESVHLESEKRVQTSDSRVDTVFFTVDGKGNDVQVDGEEAVHNTRDLDDQLGGASHSDCSMDDPKASSGSLDFEESNINEQTYCTESLLASENSQIIVDTIESELPSNNRDGESSVSEPKWLEGDESLALWVKWRGKWQAGIKCERADWPLSTLKAKPTHERKKYFVIFFPHTRNYSWADMLLVRPIYEFPEPIAHRTHKAGIKTVKDLTVARRFIMRKLAVGMLNIVDQLHLQALIEAARDVLVWKEFATEASHCTGYTDLGRMLLKLHTMILQRYISSEWLQQAFTSWEQRCQKADSAETIELLTEELFDSVLWKEVNSLEAPMQPLLNSQWRTWKHDVTKLFSTSHPEFTGANIDSRENGDPIVPNLQMNRKRPKLEVRRADVHASQIESKGSDEAATVEIDSEFFNSRDTVNGSALMSEPRQHEPPGIGGEAMASPGSVAEWDKIVVEGKHGDSIQANNIGLNLAKPVEMTPVNETVSKKALFTGGKSRQCVAFIESKGRQCVRSANEGDVYCCVHLASRFLGSSARAERTPPAETPPCQGTTVLGTKCKHRSLPGSTFCKKHRPQTDHTKSSVVSENSHKRKHEESIWRSENVHSKGVEAGRVQSLVRADPVTVSLSTVKGFGEMPEHSGRNLNGMEVAPHCIGLLSPDKTEQCMDNPSRYSLYCDKHLPSWLKRARNGKSRIISKEVFLELLEDCSSEEQKIHLHQACELFFRLFKSILSLRNPVPMEVQLQWALSEASKDLRVGEFLMKLVCSEKERLTRIWGCGATEDGQDILPEMEEEAMLPLTDDGSNNDEKVIKCKICSEEFVSDQVLGSHWMDRHKKEAQWLFRGYACAICLDSYTNKKVLETHVQERHHVQFVEQCKLLQCIPCGSHFGNVEELWSHVLSVHPSEFRSSKVARKPNPSAVKDLPLKPEPANLAPIDNNAVKASGVRKFVCRFCGLKFNLLPDLGRHHQAAHMGPSLASSRPSKKGVRYYAYQMKSGRLSRPRFKKALGAASYRIRNRASLKKRIQASKSLSSMVTNLQPHVTEVARYTRLAESECSRIAQVLFSHIQKTKCRPSNLDVLSIARSACCKYSIKASFEQMYGVLPERFYLKAAKLCSENNIHVSWHLDDFVCPNGCKPEEDPRVLSPLIPLSKGNVDHSSQHLAEHLDDEWEVDESHYVIDSQQLKSRTPQNAIVLCEDISFGRESVPIACVVDEWLLDSLDVVGAEGQNAICSMPWESFTYVTKPVVDQSAAFETESLQFGCTCKNFSCRQEACDHVYLFDNDNEDAKDIYGRSMRGRFPYDEFGRIILEESYLVYECNRMCHCSKTCHNRVLQRGVRVKLEVFRTEKKGWAVRAGEAISRGTFVCEHIGEVLDDLEADNRRKRYDGKEGGSYLFDINSHFKDMSRLTEEEVKYVIDATKYGNVSRFINHSCSPNLLNHRVLVESMESHRAHIGFYASRDIASGEELTYDYRYEVLPGQGAPCHCEASNCRGRLY